jgi:hypothetical protein
MSHADIKRVLTDEIEAFEKFYADGFPFTGVGNPHHFDSLSKCIMFEAWQARAVLAASERDQKDAERYRCWRTNLISGSASLEQIMTKVLPKEVGVSRRPTADEWDAGLDAAIAAGKAGEVKRAD